MSIRLMSAVWEIALSDSEKLILLALADWSNDAGECWPSIAQVARKSSKSERTVQGAIQKLASSGHLTRIEVPGRGCRYIIHPRGDFAPQPLRGAAAAPRNTCAPQQTTQSPAAAAPNTSRTTTSQEASPPSKARARSADPFPKPEWAESQHWADFLVNRKKKKLANTASAYTRFLSDIDRHADAEWPPGRILQHAAERGWAGIYDPRNNGYGNGQRSHDGRQSGGQRAAHPGGRHCAAADDIFGRADGR